MEGVEVGEPGMRGKRIGGDEGESDLVLGHKEWFSCRTKVQMSA